MTLPQIRNNKGQFCIMKRCWFIILKSSNYVNGAASFNSLAVRQTHTWIASALSHLNLKSSFFCVCVPKWFARTLALRCHFCVHSEMSECHHFATSLFVPRAQWNDFSGILSFKHSRDQFSKRSVFRGEKGSFSLNVWAESWNREKETHLQFTWLNVDVLLHRNTRIYFSL